MISTNSVDPGSQGEGDRIISQILQLANNLEIDTDRAMVLEAIAKKYAENRQYDRALQSVNTIIDNAYKARTLAEVVLYCAEVLPVDEVTNALYQALQIAQEIEYEEIKWSSVGFIADCCFEAGRYEQALQIARTIPNDEHQISILTKMAVAYAKAEEGTLAAETFAHAFEESNTLDDKYSRSYWWICIAADYTEAGQGNKMAEILARSQQLLTALESIELESLESYREQTETLGSFAILYAKIGLYDLAFLFANAIKEDEYSRFITLLSIAICQVDASEYSEAIEIVKPFRGNYAIAHLFRRIASEYAEQGHYSLAIDTINYIDRSVEEDDYQAALAVVTAIRATAETGDKVRDMLSQSLQIVKGCRASGLVDIVAQYAKVGLYTEALEIVRPLKNQNQKAYALESIIRQIQM
ncbi:hypothetical protein [Microcoleus asticus]|uniref:Tetratricopeptide repeat protein n=1 Tax=Microcoleus asticus IPMA8 TaxID=2563858 RepID=A0ABX2CVY6_9CYAN|nr:hypothetical protein [Microcoleus asticus]NQE34567.1 hypothetical protein [Microcoleus asticus IPMA8]